VIDKNRYLTTDDVREPMRAMITAVRKEIIDGRPHLVVYFAETEKGLILTRELAAELTKAFGPSRQVEEFFASPEGQVQ